MVVELNTTVLNGNPIDILLVEDSDTDVKITLRAFDKAKVKNNIYVVNDGIEAFDFIYHRGKFTDIEKFPRPDLILLDINMPKMNGFEVLAQIKKDPQVNFIPVIMLTSSKNDEDVLKSYQNGAVSYIPKPVSFEEFVRACFKTAIY